MNLKEFNIDYKRHFNSSEEEMNLYEDVLKTMFEGKKDSFIGAIVSNFLGEVGLYVYEASKDKPRALDFFNTIKRTLDLYENKIKREEG